MEIAEVILESFTCDICGIEKKVANHWFIAFEHNGTLKLSAWSALNRKRQMKHLCGQSCVHRLVDEFMARHSAGDLSPAASAEAPEDVSHETTDDWQIDLPVGVG